LAWNDEAVRYMQILHVTTHMHTYTMGVNRHDLKNHTFSEVSLIRIITHL
jgi:hypothetical protein